MNIVTTKQCPVYAPDTAWIAVDDQTYDGPGSPLGSGESEISAIRDLLEQIAERDAIAQPENAT